MKKLLSLLSVLTISGTAVPTTTAASPYQKEEKLNSYINYSETNNLENLNRSKRQWGAIAGGFATGVGLVDSYKSGGIVKDIVDASNNHFYNQQQDFQNYGWFGGDGSY